MISNAKTKSCVTNVLDESIQGYSKCVASGQYFKTIAIVMYMLTYAVVPCFGFVEALSSS